MSCLFDSSFKTIKTTRIGKCHVTGVHTYDMLRNQNYIQAFQYVSPYIAEREKYIKDGDEDDSNNVYQSDLVRIVLNLAFMTK